MNRELVQAWVAALRSGEYAQGCKALHPSEDEYCCLGVAHDLLVKRGEAGWVRDPGEGGVHVVDQYLPDDEAALFGLKRSQMEYLAKANDAGESFASIADRIEAVILNGGAA